MKRVLTVAGMILASCLGTLALSSPASATPPTCTTYNDGNPTGAFPADSAGHMQVCYAATSQDKANVATSVRDLNHAAGASFSKVSASGMKIFFFANQAEAADYMGNVAPYNSSPFVYAPAANAGQCGFTKNGAQGLVTGIYKTCAYGATNPDLAHTTKHEMGHAYDVVLQGLNGTGHGPSGAPDFIQMIADGKAALTPTNWSSMNQAAKDAFVCGIWGSNINSSLLEQSKLTPVGPVCNGSVVQPDYVNKTPAQIADIVAPYFVTPVEAWAELFAMKLGVQAPPGSPFLQLTDRMFISPRFKCAALDVAKWNDTGAAPTTSDLSSSCSAYQTGDLD